MEPDVRKKYELLENSFTKIAVFAMKLLREIVVLQAQFPISVQK